MAMDVQETPRELTEAQRGAIRAELVGMVEEVVVEVIAKLVADGRIVVVDEGRVKPVQTNVQTSDRRKV